MFKRSLTTALLSLLFVLAYAEEGQKVSSKVQKVTLFLYGAQVTRAAAVNINPGTTDLVFGGIASGLIAQSIQVHATGDFTILSVKHELSYINEKDKQKQLEDLAAAQSIIKGKIETQNSLLTVYQAEETTLMKNQFVKAENSTLDVLILKQALDFQTERLIAIKQKEMAITNLINGLNADLQKSYQQSSEINQKQNVSASNIIVTVSAITPQLASFSLTYLVNDASWAPRYDIKAKNISSPLTIIYKANVEQNTREDWRNVRLTLSTGNPSVSGVMPEMNPYYLNLPVNYPAADRSSYKDNSLNEVVVTSGYSASRVAGVLTTPLTVNQIENQTNVEFNIENPYTILSDGKTSVVDISQVEVKAKYQYYVAPKLNTDVFLTAQITDWNKYNFLSGEANLFFEGTYIGKSQINTRGLNDTLNVSLGVDRSILVKRTLQKELSEKQTLGSNRKETKSWVIAVKNRKNQKVNLLVEDQVPVSQNAAINVEVEETSKAQFDASTGKLSWNFVLNSQDDKKLQLTYMVKYPKANSIIVQ